MQSLSVRQTLRPIRYAIMIPAGDVEAALQAISLNTAVWGGMYNPIIPTTPEQDMMGLLKSFDPDYIVDLAAGSLPEVVSLRYADRVISKDSLFLCGKDTQGRFLRLGFGIGPVLESIHETELRGRSVESRAIAPKAASDEWDLYVSCMFGSFARLQEHADRYLDAYKHFTCAEDLFYDPDENRNHSGRPAPIDATSYGLRCFGGRGWSFSSHIVYIGDHLSVQDLLEYWNVRATGRTAWFVPLSGYQSHSEAIRTVTGAGRYKVNLSFDNVPDVQKAPSISDDNFEKVCEWVRSLDDGAFRCLKDAPRFGAQVPYDVGGIIKAAEVEASVGAESVLFDAGDLTPFKPLRPPFLPDSSIFGDHRWCLAINVADPSDSDEWMCKIPRAPGMDKILQKHCIRSGGGEAWLADRGVVIRQDYVEESLRILPVPTRDVFSALVGHATGLSVRQSNPGRFAERIIRTLGSLQFDCRILKIRGVREVIDKLSRPHSWMSKEQILAVIKSTQSDSHGANWRPDLYTGYWIGRNCQVSDTTGFLQYMLEHRILRPGTALKCASCFKEDWYHVSEFDEEFRCRFCFNRGGVDYAQKWKWQYKTDGLFMIPKGAEGSIAVILALWRLNEIGGALDRGHYATGLELCDSNGAVESEIDFCWLSLGNWRTPYELVLGEAKSFCDFKENQIAKLAELADKFEHPPYLAFVTLKDHFADSEQTLLRDLIDRGYQLLPMTRLDLDPYSLSSRFENGPHKYPQSYSDVSESLVHLHLGL